MKRILNTLLGLLMTMGLIAQTEGVGINATGNSPDLSAMLDIQSTHKGLLIPRMDSTHRKAIVNPAEGLMVYDSTTLSFWYYRKLNWTELAAGKELRDGDSDTRIEVEQSLDEDRIRMIASGKERFRIDSTGFVSTGISNGGYTGAFPDSGAGTRMMWIPSLAAFRVGETYGTNWDPGNVGFGSTVMGGEGNKATASYAIVGNGDSNHGSGVQSSVLNGENNLASGKNASVLGGEDNESSGTYGFIGDGNGNLASGYAAAVVNGESNWATARHSTVVNGELNLASGNFSSIVGGRLNIASGDSSFVGGGYQNGVSGILSAIVGGDNNRVIGDTAFVGGGRSNLAAGNYSAIVGGQGNQAFGRLSFVAGGRFNFAPSYGEAVVGIYSAPYTPQSATAYHPEDRIFSVGNGTGGFVTSNALTILKSGRVGIGTTTPHATALLDLSSSDKGILIPRMNSSNRLAISSPAEGLMVYDSTTNNFQYFSSGIWNALTGSGGGSPADYIQDADADTRIEVEQSPDEDRIRMLTQGKERLLVDTTGIMSAGTFVPNYNGVLPDSGAGTRMMWLPAKGAFRVGRATGPEWNNYLIGDFSTVTGGSSNMAAGNWATVAGGETNNASASYAAVLGGFQNRAAGNSASVAGGAENLASGSSATVGGGLLNTSSADFSTIAGGRSNSVSAELSAIAGGFENQVSGTRSFIGSGFQNAVSGNQSVIAGGYQNTLTATRAFIGGGFQNNASGIASVIGGGFFNQATGEYTTVSGGNQNVAAGNYSFVGGGTNNTAHSYGEAVLGLFAENYSPQRIDSFDRQDRLFVIGNGTSPFARSNALTLLKNGNLGLGTSTPDTTLHIAGKIKYEDGTQQDGYVLTSDAQGMASWQPAGLAGGDTIWGKTANGSIYALNAGHTVTGANSLVAGTNNTVLGGRSLAVGTQHVLENPYNYSFGAGNRMSGGAGFAFGFNDTLSDYAGAAFAFGSDNLIRSAFSGTFGLENRLTSFFGPSYAIGLRNLISGDRGVAIGYKLVVPGYEEFAIGTYNELYSPSGGTTDRLFTIGNGSDDNMRSNALTILQNGSMGLGTSTPSASALLEMSSTEKGLLIPRMSSSERQNIANPAQGLMVYDLTTSSFWHFSTSWQQLDTNTQDDLGNHTASQNLQLGSHWLSGDGGNEGIAIDANGNVGIGDNTPSARLDVDGTGRFTANGTQQLRMSNLEVNTNPVEIFFDRTTMGLAQRSAIGVADSSRGFFIWHNNADRLNIDYEGKVGIGTSTPQARLDVNGDTYLNGSVGVGTSDPQAPLHVASTSTISSFTGNPNGGAWMSVGSGAGTDEINWANGAGSTEVSIYASGSIVANGEGVFVGATVNWSDRRIKEIEGLSDPAADLETLRKIEITDYRKIDGGKPEKKVIAQQVREVFPQAVSLREGVIPSIYAHIQTFEFDAAEGILTITTPKAHDLLVADLIDFYTEEQQFVKQEVLEVVSDRTFRVKADARPAQLFVFGKWVDDVHTVDYHALAMLNLSATQEQQRRIEELEKMVNTLQVEKATFEARFEALEALLGSSQPAASAQK